MQAIQARKDLTDEWTHRGVKQGAEFVIPSDEITKSWSGFTTRQYKTFKGLKRENLMDNMSMLELALNQLTEATTTEISRKKKPDTFEKNKAVAKHGGSIAGNAQKEIEAQTSEPVITSKKTVDFARLLADVVDYKVDNSYESKAGDKDRFRGAGVGF